MLVSAALCAIEQVDYGQPMLEPEFEHLGAVVATRVERRRARLLGQRAHALKRAPDRAMPIADVLLIETRCRGVRVVATALAGILAREQPHLRTISVRIAS